MAKQTIPRSMTQEELRTLYKVSKDPYFFATFIYVINPVLGRVRFDLYPYQKSVLYQFLKERFNIILKFRQAGLTELISMYCLWLCMFHPNKKVNIISIKDTVAKKVLKKIKFMYKNLPWYLQTPIINGRAGEFGSVTSMEFCNGSLIESIPTSEQAGRSESLSLLVIDEAAAVRWANSIWAAAFPTLSCCIGSTKLFKRTYENDKPFTEVVNLRTLCPKEKSTVDISHLNYYTLTHRGQWKKITHSQNKGKLETWFIKDCKGNKGGYTPAHQLFTTQGWKTVREIIEQDLNVIMVDTKYDLLSPTLTPCKKPKEEILKPIKDFPDYLVSNWGNVYKKTSKGLRLLSQRKNKDGYFRVHLTRRGIYRDSGSDINKSKLKTFARSVHKLVAEAFIGPLPQGFCIDHIDEIRTHNYPKNLRYVSASVNISRSYEGRNLNALLQPISGSRLPDIQVRGRILEMAQDGFSSKEIAREVYPYAKQGHKFVNRILKERGSNRVYISKLDLVKKTTRTIYDIQVEDDHSYVSANNFVNHNTGGSAIINSTPLGTGNWYHSMWVDAVQGANGVNPIRLRWDMHPDRDDKWYTDMAKALGPKRTAQEIDGDFLSSGNTVFDLNDIKGIEEDIYDYPVLKTRFGGAYKEFCEVDPNKEYFIGADCATGRSTDYSSFTVMDAGGEEQAIYKGRIPLDKYAILLGDVGEKFNYAKIAPETNDIGAAVTMALQTEGYPNLYYSQKLLKKKGKARPEVELIPGWLTTTKNRSVIIEGLEKDIREGNIIVKDPFFVQEAYTFIYDGSGRPVAMGKHKRASSVDIDLEGETYSDDDIFGKAITNHIRKQINNNVGVLPQ